jgi:hypothetical protein
MSAATASSTDWTEVHVRLLDEGVDVWRPVPAQAISEHVFQLSADPAPADEQWAFSPGDRVVAERRSAEGRVVMVAVARATDVDEPSSLWLRLAG